MTKDADAATKKPDDLNAVRIIREALEGFTADDQERILRWARESLGLTIPTPKGAPSGPASMTERVRSDGPGGTPKDIKTFVDQKAPRSDVQLAATIAYYYRFEALEKDKKDEIDATFLREACRLAGRPGALVHPLKTLNNAHARGLLDRGSARGTFTINSVGENLVGMTLPGGTEQAPRPRSARGAKKAPRKKRVK
jgi:hypothetical protein